MSVIFISRSAEFLSEMEKDLAKALEVIGGKAEGYAYDLCPKDTGNLANSISPNPVNDHTIAIGTEVEYAPYVELGYHTSTGKHVAGRPYLRPAVENHESEYRNVIKAIMGRK